MAYNTAHTCSILISSSEQCGIEVWMQQYSYIQVPYFTRVNGEITTVITHRGSVNGDIPNICHLSVQ